MSPGAPVLTGAGVLASVTLRHTDFGPSLTIKGKTNEDPGVWGAEAVDLAVMDWFLLVINSYFKGLETQQFS